MSGPLNYDESNTETEKVIRTIQSVTHSSSENCSHEKNTHYSIRLL